MSKIPGPDRFDRYPDDAAQRSHVRRPSIPWRASNLTECGRKIGETTGVLDRAEFLARLKEQGPTRCALTTCMTCWETASRHPSWDEDPIASLVREVEGARGYPSKHQRETRGRFKFELIAIAALIERHRGEFDELVADQEEIVPIGTAREKRQQ